MRKCIDIIQMYRNDTRRNAMSYEFDTEEEKIECYQEAMMTSKDDILSAIRLERMSWNAKAKEDTRHSAAYYGVLNKLTDRFISKIENTILFDAPYGMWAYMFVVTSDGMVLRLEHASSVDFDDTISCLLAIISIGQFLSSKLFIKEKNTYLFFSNFSLSLESITNIIPSVSFK